VPQLRLDSYSQDMRALARAVTDVPAATGQRVQRAGSTTMVDVNVHNGAEQVTILLREGGLYVKGFRNDQGTDYFFKEPEAAGNQLKFSCSYVGNYSIGIFTDPDHRDTKATRSRNDLDRAVRDLAAFRGGNDLHLKIPLALMAFSISESIRFSTVFDRMIEVCRGNKTFTFLEFKDYVQNWQAITEGRVPAGVKPNSVFTNHG